MDRAGPMENAPTRFPQVLGRRTARAAHNAPQAVAVYVDDQEQVR